MKKTKHNMKSKSGSLRDSAGTAGAEYAEKLETLLRDVESQAHEIMRTEGRFTLRTVMILDNERYEYSPGPLLEMPEMDDFGIFSRLICAAHGIQAAVLATQIWVLRITPGESNDPNLRPQQPPQRKEHICLFGEAPGGLCQKWLLPVLRDERGRFSGLGPKDVIRGAALDQFPHLLPQGPIPEDVRSAATGMLKDRRTHSHQTQSQDSLRMVARGCYRKPRQT